MREIPEKYIALVLQQFPDKDRNWVVREMNRAYDNADGPRPFDDMIEDLLKYCFEITV